MQNIITRVEFIKSAYSASQFPPERLPEAAFAGRSNAGKSSIINALLSRRNLVRTSSRPGFTQAINFFLVDERIFFVDLPGYGFAKTSKRMQSEWKILIEDYFQSKRAIKVVICIFDIRRIPDQMDAGLLNYLAALGIKALIVLNKADKIPQPKRVAQVKAITRVLNPMAFDSGSPLLVSARTGEGISELLARISLLLLP
ncbi:MAG: ribosome biogenesis GTP-binding protein YihA/YsxC [Dissulfurimicrobium sp.]|uniref:ribosome biogenesis GTP-binding protein YihA/YsxC n=1 Tax=Dissulfurimicrobium sp. TaxID=2022436 RepID=UPI00404AD556